MQIHLGIRHINSFHLECLQYAAVKVAFETKVVSGLHNRPKPQRKIHGAVGEFRDHGLRRRITEDERMLTRDLLEAGTDFIEIAVIADTNGKRQSNLRIVGGPVGDSMRG